MREHATYVINITDPEEGKANPKHGHANHKVWKYDENGNPRELDMMESIRYLMDRENHDDLSFNTSLRGVTTLVFNIKHPDWFFADPPFTIEVGSDGRTLDGEVTSRDFKQATIRVPGSSKSDNSHKYTLHYRRQDGSDAFSHDPVIRNGHLDPGPGS